MRALLYLLIFVAGVLLLTDAVLYAIGVVAPWMYWLGIFSITAIGISMLLLDRTLYDD